MAVHKQKVFFFSVFGIKDIFKTFHILPHLTPAIARGASE